MTAVSGGEVEGSSAYFGLGHNVGVVIEQQLEDWKTFSQMNWTEASVVRLVGVSAMFKEKP